MTTYLLKQFLSFTLPVEIIESKELLLTNIDRRNGLHFLFLYNFIIKSV